MNLLIYKIIVMELLEILNDVNRCPYHINDQYHLYDIDYTLSTWLPLRDKNSPAWEGYLAKGIWPTISQIK